MSVNYTAKRCPQGCCRCDRPRLPIGGCRTGRNKVAYAWCLQAVGAGEARMETNVAAYWIWWVLACVLVGAELFTGTFYLLAVGAAFAIGGVAAWLGGSTPIQLLIGGVLAVLGTVAAHQWRKRHA